jgi:hypothetical protein
MTARGDFIWKHGVMRWGLTSAVLSGVCLTWRRFGTLSSKPALIYLVVWLVAGIPSIALLGGYLYGWTMWRLFYGPDGAQRNRRTRPPTDGRDERL